MGSKFPKNKTLARRFAGIGRVALGIAFNFGLFFVPVTAVIQDPTLLKQIPMPEAIVGWWLALVGIAVALWPGSRGKAHPGSAGR